MYIKPCVREEVIIYLFLVRDFQLIDIFVIEFLIFKMVALKFQSDHQHYDVLRR